MHLVMLRRLHMDHTRAELHRGTRTGWRGKHPIDVTKEKGRSSCFSVSWLTSPGGGEGARLHGWKSEATRSESVVREAPIRLDLSILASFIDRKSVTRYRVGGYLREFQKNQRTPRVLCIDQLILHISAMSDVCST